MDLQLQDHVILISGAASGIGAATSWGLAREGAIPFLVDRDAAACAALAAALTQAGHRCATWVGELDAAPACAAAVEAALSAFGRLDGLVNNAGFNDGVGLEQGSEAAFLASLRANLLHYYLLAHYALPALKAGPGAIVNVASKVALRGQGHTSGYAAAKGGQLALTRDWAVELRTYGIRVNAVVPAEVETPSYTRWLATLDDPEGRLTRIRARIPLGQRLTQPSEIADMIIFLLSARASHITGEHFVVDGGYTHLDRAI